MDASSKTFFFTLSVVDGSRWASSKELSGMFVVNSKTGEELHFGDLDVKELTDETLQVTASNANGQKLQITMSEKQMEVKLLSPHSAAWTLEIRAASGAELPFRKVVGRTLQSEFRGHSYELSLIKGHYQFTPEKKTLRIQPFSGVVKFDMSRG